MKKRLLLVFAVILLLAACSGRADFKRGLFLYNKGQTLASIKIFSAIIKSGNKDAAVYAARATALARLATENPQNKDRYNQLAENDFFAALSLAPTSPEILTSIGSFYVDQGLYVNALVYLNDAVKYGPNYALAFVNRGIANFRAGNGSAAWADFNQALQLDPKNQLARYNRAEMFFAWKMYEPAIDDMTYVVDYSPTSATALVERGRMLQAAGYYTQAMDDYHTATLVNPNFYLGFYHYGEMLFKKGNIDQALVQVSIAKELNNTYAPSYDLMGDILAVEDPLSAAANYVIAKNLDPAKTAYYNDKMQKMLTSEGRRQVVVKRFQ